MKPQKIEYRFTLEQKDNCICLVGGLANVTTGEGLYAFDKKYPAGTGINLIVSDFMNEISKMVLEAPELIVSSCDHEWEYQSDNGIRIGKVCKKCGEGV